MDFVVRIYEISEGFPKEEKYGLIAQLRGCAVSIPSNISEGAGRATNKQFRYFLEFSMGSCNEAQTQIELAHRFGYISKEILEELNGEGSQIYKMILAFYNSLNNAD